MLEQANFKKNRKETENLKFRLEYVSEMFLFLQLPEPLILFRLYNEFIGLAKESQNVNEELDAKQASPKSKKRQSICIELNRIIIKIKDLLKQLPVPNYNTLQYLTGHLHR